MMADLLAVNPSTAACPAPKVPVAHSMCRTRQCARHSDCQKVNHLCCFNGCVFTCLTRVAPPAGRNAHFPLSTYFFSSSSRNFRTIATQREPTSRTNQCDVIGAGPILASRWGKSLKSTMLVLGMSQLFWSQFNARIPRFAELLPQHEFLLWTYRGIVNITLIRYQWSTSK